MFNFHTYYFGENLIVLIEYLTRTQKKRDKERQTEGQKDSQTAREVFYGFIFALKNVMFCSLIITGWEGQPGMVQSMSGPAKEIFEQNRELYGSVRGSEGCQRGRKAS